MSEPEPMAEPEPLADLRRRIAREAGRLRLAGVRAGVRQRLRRLPLIGSGLRWAYGLAMAPRRIRDLLLLHQLQDQRGAARERALDDLRRDVRSRSEEIEAHWLSRLEAVAREVAATRGLLTGLEEAGRRQGEAAHGLEQQLSALDGRLQRLQSELGSRQGELSQELAELSRQLVPISHALPRLESDLETASRALAGRQAADDARAVRLAAAQSELSSTLQDLAPRVAGLEAGMQSLREPTPAGMGRLYMQLEERFRGPQDLVSSRQQGHVQTVLEAARACGSRRVLDLGCGRGEWLRLLATAQLEATGVDVSAEAAALCAEAGLQVVTADALEFLREAPADAFAAVTVFHLAEHLSHPRLVALLDGALRCLRPHGVLMLETPDPANARVAAWQFYLDPTHRAPLPRELTEFLLEQRGFSPVEIRGLHPDPGGESGRGLDQDYVALGWKPSAPGA